MATAVTSYLGPFASLGVGAVKDVAASAASGGAQAAPRARDEGRLAEDT